jgi:hypothetical protein
MLLLLLLMMMIKGIRYRLEKTRDDRSGIDGLSFGRIEFFDSCRPTYRVQYIHIFLSLKFQKERKKKKINHCSEPFGKKFRR